MKDYVIKRLLLFIPTLIIITMITFLVCRLAPGDPTEMKIGQTGEAQKTDAKNLMNEQAKEFYKEIRTRQISSYAICLMDGKYAKR